MSLGADGSARTMAPVRRTSEVTPSAPTRKARRERRDRSSPWLARQLAVHRPMAPLRMGASIRRKDRSASTSVMATRRMKTGTGPASMSTPGRVRANTGQCQR